MPCGVGGVPTGAGLVDGEVDQDLITHRSWLFLTYKKKKNVFFLKDAL